VLAPNAPLRAAVTALAQVSAPLGDAAADDPPPDGWRSPARYLWAMLLARIYEVFPLQCPHCGAEMRIIAFITETAAVRGILEHIGEPPDPPRVASARGPPEWYEDTGVVQNWDDESATQGDPLVQPEYEYDQRVTW